MYDELVSCVRPRRSDKEPKLSRRKSLRKPE
jgi:hypothetical protein